MRSFIMKKLTGIIVKNEDSGFYVAFIKEQPGLSAQAKTVEEVKSKLTKAWINFLEYNKRNNPIEFNEPETI